MKNIGEMTATDIRAAYRFVDSLSTGYSKHDLESIVENNPTELEGIYLDAFSAERALLMCELVLKSLCNLKSNLSDRLTAVKLESLTTARVAIVNIDAIIELLKDISTSDVVSDSPLLSLQTYSGLLNSTVMVGDLDIIKDIQVPTIVITRGVEIPSQMLQLDVERMFSDVSIDNDLYHGAVLKTTLGIDSLTINNAVDVIRGNSNNALVELTNALNGILGTIGEATMLSKHTDDITDGEISKWVELEMSSNVIRKYAEDNYSIAMLKLIKHILIIDRD